MRIYYVIQGALGSLANSLLWKREVPAQSGTPVDQSGARESYFSVDDWSEGSQRSVTFRLLAPSVRLGVFHVYGFTGVVVVFLPEGKTVRGKTTTGIVLAGLWE